MMQYSTLIRWLSIPITIAIVVLADYFYDSWRYHTFLEGSMDLGLLLIWIPYVINTGTITSTRIDEKNERLLRYIGWFLLLIPFLWLVISLLSGTRAKENLSDLL